MDIESNYVFYECVNDGKCTLESVVVQTMSGVNICLVGGEESHIGSVAVSIPRPSLTGDGSISCTTSVFNLSAHKDDALAVPLAEELSKQLNQVVVVSAGVHIEKITTEEVTRIKSNLGIIKNLIMKHLNEYSEGVKI